MLLVKIPKSKTCDRPAVFVFTNLNIASRYKVINRRLLALGPAMWLGHGGFLKSASLQNSLGHLTAVGAPFISRARFKYFKMTQRSLSPASLLAAVGAPEHSIGHKKFVHWYMRALLKISMAGIWFSDYGLNRSFGPFRPRRRRSFARWAGRWPT